MSDHNIWPDTHITDPVMWVELALVLLPFLVLVIKGFGFDDVFTFYRIND